MVLWDFFRVYVGFGGGVSVFFFFVSWFWVDVGHSVRACSFGALGLDRVSAQNPRLPEPQTLQKP